MTSAVISESVNSKEYVAMRRALVWRIAVASATCIAPLFGEDANSSPHPQAGDTKAISLPKGESVDLVWVPAGEFMMGSEAYSPSEKPVHRVRITAGFWLGKYEVTQSQWQAVVGSDWSLATGKGRPVDRVSWKHCQLFVRRLNALGQEGTFAIPTEAEWEYACRAGSTTEWCFGDDESRLGDYAWWRTKWRVDAPETTHPVGKKKPNGWGLYDMHGNVAEWCADWYADDYYARSPSNDPGGPRSGSWRVLRGGSVFDLSPLMLRSAFRIPGAIAMYTGCRILFRPRESR